MPALNKIMIYAKNVQRTADFYEKHFGFKQKADADGRIVELIPSAGGAHLLLHQAAKSIKSGQVNIKLVFDVKDIEGFKKKSAKNGLVFGATHLGDNYSFANAKDPDKNSVSISSRAFRSG